jgi:peroxiredoxin/tetratricopeptide (TPR) repeat protein
MRSLIWRAAAICALLAPLAAQEPAADPFGHSRHGGEFNEGPRRAAYAMPGMSPQVRFPVQGLSPEAQAFFDQGVCQQHGFWYFEAERSFRQVATLQPECAMAYWGMAMANVENWQRAAGFAAQAVQRQQGLPARESLWIDALAVLYQIDDALKADLRSGDADKAKTAKEAIVGKKERDEKKLHREFLRGIEAVVAACPDDVEAKAFLAIQSWRNSEHGIAIGSHGAVDALLDQVFAVAPAHPAHHYRIHLWDSEKAERALRSAAANGDSAPAIAHQWHMSGHIYAKLHRHREASWQQDASGRADHAHMMRDRVMPFLIHNYGHNQEWLARSLGYVGDGEAALAIAKNMAALPRHPAHNKLDDGEDIAGYARARVVQVCEDLELWDDAVAICRDGYLEQDGTVKGEVQRLGLLGRALFRLGRVDEAQRVVADADALLLRARAERAAAIDKAEDEAFTKKTDRGKTVEAIAEAGREPTNSVRSVLDLRRELAGEAKLAAGDASGALAEFEAVGDMPKWLLADAHVAAGQADKAVEILAKEVKERPRRLATTARLLLALRAQSKPENDARIAELTAELAGPQYAIGAAGLAVRAGLAPADGRGARALGEGFAAARGEDFGARRPLADLGPSTWSPVPNPGFDLVAADGSRRALAVGGGRPTLVVFYLGFGCLHCVEQLKALAPKAGDFAAAGVDVVAIGNEPLAKLREHIEALGDQPLPFPLLADAELAAFKAWHCHDDFEGMPLHGTFLVDGDGKVRWQDVSFEPFTRVDWLLAEARRLLALPAQSAAR